MSVLHYRAAGLGSADELLDAVVAAQPLQNYLTNARRDLLARGPAATAAWREVVLDDDGCPVCGREAICEHVWVELVPDREADVDRAEAWLAWIFDKEVQELYELPIGGRPTRDADWNAIPRHRITEVRPGNRWVALSAFPVPDTVLAVRPATLTLTRQLDAIRELTGRPSPHHGPLLRLLGKPEAPWPDPALPAAPIDWKFLTDVTREGTSEQRRFVTKALGSSDLAILEGPPGSGKTTAICELVVQEVRLGHRVLLCASTHVAVDNVLERLITDLDGGRVRPLRIGQAGVVSGVVRPWLRDRVHRDVRRQLVDHLSRLERPTLAQEKLNTQLGGGWVEDAVASTANVVCGTPEGLLGFLRVRRGEAVLGNADPYDVLILDEASKTTLQELLVPALFARRIVLVGDVRQLSPFIDQDSLAVNLADLVTDVPAEALEYLLTTNGIERPADLTPAAHWANEVAWRLGSLFQYRMRQGSEPVEQRRRLEGLMNLGPFEERVRARVGDVESVAMPSVLESVQRGLPGRRLHAARTVLTDGLPGRSLVQRHTRLRYQHRMHPSISSFARSAFYDDAALLDSRAVTDGRDWDYEPYQARMIWLDVRPAGASQTGSPDAAQRAAEARRVVEEVTRFARWASGASWRVAVLVFHNEHLRTMRSAIGPVADDAREREEFHVGGVPVRVCNVDRFQGHEADLVFLSLGLSHATSFMRAPNRLNVALTRARYQLVIVGNNRGFRRSGRTAEPLGQLAAALPVTTALGA